MLELYLISVLGHAKTFLEVTAFLCGIAFTMTAICLLQSLTDDFFDINIKSIKRIAKYTFLSAVISGFLSVFIPNKAELCMIMGIGGTIDYLKENNIANQIPDKCLKLIDKWLEEEINEQD